MTERVDPGTGSAGGVATIEQALPGPLRNGLLALGGMYSMGAGALWGLIEDLVRRRFQFTEFMQRSWFLVSVTLLPVVLVD